jgi:N-acylneuraminate cytidylyltransferase
MSEVVAVIPARGGSTGIPGKNLTRVGGVPLVARAIAAARRVREIDRVVVSTDDADIAAVAVEHGAEVITRPAAISGDEASSESALLHALDVLTERGVDVEVLAFLQATSPFIDSGALREAVDVVVSGRHDSVFAATETHGFLWRRSPEGEAVAVNHEAATRQRRQDREPEFLETGAFYVMRSAAFRRTRHRFCGSVGLVVVPGEGAMEIDDVWQLEAARALAPLLERPTPIDVDAVVTDFDGVHTDDTASVDQDGTESVRVSRSDGMGVKLLRRAGIPVLILSTEQNPVVAARARKLSVEVRHGVDDKASALREWAAASGIPLGRIAYLGNDVNDLGCLALVGWPVAVADANPLVRASARAVTTAPGGHGAVRELAERVLEARAQSAVAATVAAEQKETTTS